MQVLRRRRGFTWIELLVVLAIVCILAAVLVPIFTRPRFPLSVGCQANLKQIGLGFQQYAQDWDGRWVAAAPNPVSRSDSRSWAAYGWADALQPYVKSTEILQCPGEATSTPGEDALRPGFTDYWMNLNMSRAQDRALQLPWQTILCGEGNDGRDGTDARYSRNVLPHFWLADENSPARRHLDTMNVLFVAGNVKRVKAGSLTTGAPSESGGATPWTFALK